MKYAIFSDLHADDRGLDLLISHPEFKSADKRICLGDVINAQDVAGAKEYFDKVKSLSDNIVMGNHEAVLAGDCSVEIFHQKHHQNIQTNRTGLDREEPDFIKSLSLLPMELFIGDARARHASFDKSNLWSHVRYVEDVQKQEPFLTHSINILAHGHVPFIAWKGIEGMWYYQRQIYGQSFFLKPDNKYILNCGSILGSREMRQEERSFLVYDDQQAKISFFKLGES